VRDFLDRFDADALRYYLVAASPETQDTEFTWEEFVRRSNDELLANWGNLVNRTLTNAHRNFGAVPEPGPLTDADRALLGAISGGFESVGSLIERGRIRSALAEAMRLSSEVNQYVSETAPWALVKTDRERAATVLYVALQAVDSLKVIFTPFLPHTSQQVHELLGYDGWLAGPLEFREVTESDGRTHQVLTGDYSSWVGRWEPSTLPPGQTLLEPRPLFRKLDPSTGEDELGLG
jgi:methionyl-tRNA synthetase